MSPHTKDTPACIRTIQIYRGRHSPGRRKRYTCRNLRCEIEMVSSTSLEDMHDSDAVVIYHDTPRNWTLMHTHRPKKQKWVLHTYESPWGSKKNRHIVPPDEYYNTTYNYIMSYRTRDSDIYGSYGYYLTRSGIDSISFRSNWALNKTRVVMWMARNCHFTSWPRQQFVETLSKYVDIDTYGECGNNSCVRGDDCNDILRSHKFYLALENSQCRQYITEKVWRNSFINDVVPIVFGPPREDYELVMPPGSFIFVQDFTSIEELGQYITKVNYNNTLYNSFFEWKTYGQTIFTPQDVLFGPENMCHLVQLLLDDESSIESVTYSKRQQPNWQRWWHGSCHRFFTISSIFNAKATF